MLRRDVARAEARRLQQTPPPPPRRTTTSGAAVPPPHHNRLPPQREPPQHHLPPQKEAPPQQKAPAQRRSWRRPAPAQMSVNDVLASEEVKCALDGVRGKEAAFNRALKVRLASRVLRAVEGFAGRGYTGLTPAAYAPALRFFADAAMPDAAEACWEMMVRAGVTPDAASYEARLRACLLGGDASLRQAAAAWQDMEARGVAATPTARTLLCVVLAKSGCFEDALALAEAGRRGEAADRKKAETAALAVVAACPGGPAHASLLLARFPELQQSEPRVGCALLQACRWWVQKGGGGEHGGGGGREERSKSATAAAVKIFAEISEPTRQCYVHLALVYQCVGDVEKVVETLGACCGRFKMELTDRMYVVILRAAELFDGEEDREKRRLAALGWYEKARMAGQVKSMAMFVSLLRLAGNDCVMAEDLRRDAFSMGFSPSPLFLEVYAAVYERAGQAAPRFKPSLSVVGKEMVSSQL